MDAARYGFAARACGSLSRERICVGYIPSAVEPTWINGFECGMDNIQFYPPGSDIDYLAGPGASWVAIEFDEALFHQVAIRRLGHSFDIGRHGAANLSVASSLRSELERMVERSFLEPQSSHLLIEPIIGWVVDLLFELRNGRPAGMARKWKRRVELLDRAERYLKSHLGQPFDCKSLALAVGVTERSLQKHFRERYGMSPGHWARCLSLHHARKRLLECDPRRFTVESVARESGFGHMGRFAGSYEELFGEFPSATLARQQCDPAGNGCAG